MTVFSLMGMVVILQIYLAMSLGCSIPLRHLHRLPGGPVF